MAYHGLSFCYLIYCSNISPQKYVFAIHFVILAILIIYAKQIDHSVLTITLNFILISTVIHSSLCFKTNTKAGDRLVLQSVLSAFGFPSGSVIKEFACNAGHAQETQVRSVVWKDPTWRRKWQSTPGEFHGQRNLAGYTVHGGHKKSDATE